MADVVQRFLGWAWTAVGVGPHFRSGMGTFCKRQQAWRYARTNDQDVYRGDPNLDAVQDAERLQKDDPGAAFPLLLALAERGSAWGMLLTGWAHLDGSGVAADQAEAERWFRRSADLGCEQAQLRLGHLCMERRDHAEAERIYGAGAGDTWAPSTYYLAWAKLRQARTPQRQWEARHLLERAAAQGGIEAEMDVAVLMARGRFGLRLIPAGVARTFRAAIKVGAAIEGRAPASRD